jgi:hypothetical protein
MYADAYGGKVAASCCKKAASRLNIASSRTTGLLVKQGKELSHEATTS